MPEFLIHQALHGYDDGHRQMACSIALKPQDSKTLMTLSDSSGSGIRFPDAGYLTGYPLVDSGYYVLARTWSAPEMPRPGCVWTHSLLIDFADFATLPDVSSLLQYFCRPSRDSFSSFRSDLTYSAHESSGIDPQFIGGAEQLLSALYETPRANVVVPSTGPLDERLVLNILSQQWPRLRRSFRFCTCSAADRSTKVAPFDIQILPADGRSIRSRFADSLEAGTRVALSKTWIDSALMDLALPDVNGLRTFMRQVGGDVAGGRDAFVSLCRLHVLAANEIDQPEKLHEAIELFESLFAVGQGRAARSALVNTILRNIHNLDDVVLKFLLKNLENVVASADDAELKKIGLALWNFDRQLVSQFYSKDGAEREIVKRGVSHLPIESLAIYADEVPSLFAEIIDARPEILAESLFWRNLRSTNAALDYACKGDPYPAAVAIVNADRDDLVEDTFRILGSVVTGRAVLSVSPDKLPPAWLRSLTSRPQLVMNLLGAEVSYHRISLVRLASEIGIDYELSSFRCDPWFIAWVRAVGEVAKQDEAYFLAFLMARAIRSVADLSTEIVAYTFNPVYKAIVGKLLPDKGRVALERRLPSILLENDLGVRLCTGVVWHFIDRGVQPSVFLELASDDHGFYALVNAAKASIRGRAYLKKVRYALKETGNQQSSYQSLLLDKVL